MRKFDKYFSYFIIVSVIFICGTFSYAMITEGLRPGISDPGIFQIIFSFIGYMFGMMITLGIMLATLVVFEEKKPEDITDKEWSKKTNNRICAAFMVSCLWPAVVVYTIAYHIFSYMKKREEKKKDKNDVKT